MLVVYDPVSRRVSGFSKKGKLREEGRVSRQWKDFSILVCGSEGVLLSNLKAVIGCEREFLTWLDVMRSSIAFLSEGNHMVFLSSFKTVKDFSSVGSRDGQGVPF